MKKFVLFLLAAVPVFAISDFTAPYSSFSDSGIIYASEHNANWDSIQTHHNVLIDTLDIKFIRFTDLTSGDSNLTLLEVDSIRQLEVIRGNPDIDSAKGNPTYHTGRLVVDTATVNKNLSADSVFATKGITAGAGLKGTTGNFSSVVVADSFYTAKGVNVLYADIQRMDIDTLNSLNKISGNPIIDSAQLAVISGLNIMRGNPDIDSAQIGVISGANVIRGNPDIDSISGSPKINAVTVLGTASVDSLFSTKGIAGTTARFSASSGVGAPSVEAWHSTYRALQIGGNAGFMSSATEDTSQTFYILQNIYFDGAWKRMSTDEVSVYALTNGSHLWYGNATGTADVGFTPTQRMSLTNAGLLTVTGAVSADSVFSTKGITGTKINTGLGNFEVGQDLATTSDVTFDSLYLTGFLSFGNEPIKVFSDSIMMADSIVYLAKKWYKSDTLSVHYRRVLMAEASIGRGCISACTNGYNMQVFHGNETTLSTDVDASYTAFGEYTLLADSVGVAKTVFRIRAASGTNSFADPIRLFAVYKP